MSLKELLLNFVNCAKSLSHLLVVAQLGWLRMVKASKCGNSAHLTWIDISLSLSSNTQVRALMSMINDRREHGAFQFQTKDNYLKSTMLNDHFKGSLAACSIYLYFFFFPISSCFLRTNISLSCSNEGVSAMEFLELKHPLTHASKR